MLSRLHSSLLSSLILVGAACGDDGNTSASGTTTGTTTDTPTTDDTTTAGPTTEETPTTSTSTTDDTTTTTAPDPTTGEPGTTGVMPGDCAAPADDADEDGDTIANKDDNCRCDPNPNQLDFDGNSVGNVCDAPLTFTIADGVPPEFNQLDSTASAEMGLGCEFPVSLIALGGDVQVSLDDQGTAKIFAAQLTFADTPELTCEIPLILTVKLIIQDLVITGIDPFTVGFPFTMPDHDGGMLTGMMDMIHNILVDGVINVTESSNEQLAMPGESPLMDVPGSFPAGMVTVVNAGEQIAVDFDSNDHIVFQQTTEGGLVITLTGLTGKLQLRR